MAATGQVSLGHGDNSAQPSRDELACQLWISDSEVVAALYGAAPACRDRLTSRPAAQTVRLESNTHSTNFWPNSRQLLADSARDSERWPDSISSGAAQVKATNETQTSNAALSLDQFRRKMPLARWTILLLVAPDGARQRHAICMADSPESIISGLCERSLARGTQRERRDRSAVSTWENKMHHLR